MKDTIQPLTDSTHQTVSLEISTATGSQSIRIGFTDQRLTAYGGMAVWSSFLHKRGVRQQLEAVLPHERTSPNAYEPTDVTLGLLGGILCGAEKLTHVAHLRSDAAMSEVLGIEAIPSQSTLTRFLKEFAEPTSGQLNRLHLWCAGRLPSLKEGYTLDFDSWALLHEDGHQEGVAIGYTRSGLKPCHHPLIACLAEAKLVAGYWLRRGDSASAHQAPRFLEETLSQLPKHITVGLIRADAGFYHEAFLQSAESRALNYIVVARLYKKIQKFCRHDDAAWTATEVKGIDAQEVAYGGPGRRLIIIRHRQAERSEAGGKELLDIPGYKFQALITNLPASWSAVAIWRKYNGRGESENRIKELGAQFGIRRLCCQKFWATEAVHHLAIFAYNLCVLLQRELGLLQKHQLITLRQVLFCRAGVWSRAQGRGTLKLAVPRRWREWWLRLLEKLSSSLPPLNCNAVEFPRTLAA